MEVQTNSDIGSLVRKLETNFVNGTGTLMSKFVNLNMYDELNTIDAYLNSKHISGEFDSLGREKPFFNIVIAAANIWFRATDIDRKNIRLKATKRGDVITSFLANAKVQEYMKKDNFGQFLNDWGLGLARYGSYVSKHVEQNGELYSMPIPWNRIIVDAIDFENNPKIELLELTPAQLKKKKGYDKEMVKLLVNAVSDRELSDGQKKDNLDGYIKLYEIHGEMPLSFLTGNPKDEDENVQQMQVISFVESKEKGRFDDYVLVKGREDKDPYMITHLIKTDGYTLSTGAVKGLFQSQWIMNHTTKSIKDQLDLASKLIFQTSDGNFIGQNALTAIEQGDIMIHALNQPLTQIANNSHDITSLQNYATQWKQLGNEINGISESMLGITPPSGTPYRQTEQLLQENHSLFEIMKQNKGLALEQMMRKFIIPYVKTQLDTTDEIVATLDTYGIDRIDEIYLKNEPVRRTNRRLVQEVIRAGENGAEMPNIDTQQQIMTEETANVQGELNDMGGQRFLKPSEEPDKTWKDIFKNYEWEAEVEITPENSNRAEALTTLNSLLTVAANPVTAQALQTPTGKLIVNKILNATGEVSEMELSTIKNQPVQPQMAQPIA